MTAPLEGGKMFAGQKKIKIDGDLYEKAKALADEKGYSSVEELIKHLLDTATSASGEGTSKEDDEAIKDKLSGLGYIS